MKNYAIIAGLACFSLNVMAYQSVNDIEDQISRDSNSRITILSDSLWGHDTNRSTSGHEISELVLADQCELHRQAPGFFTDQVNREQIVLEPVACHPLRIAREIQNRFEVCDARTITVEKFTGTSGNWGEWKISVDEKCLCTYELSFRKTLAIYNLVSPLNLVFNGPDYHDSLLKLATNKDECVSLFSKERQGIVAEIFEHNR